MKSYLIKNATAVNEGRTFSTDLLIKNGRIEKMAEQISTEENVEEINAEGLHLFPGVIDDQVHFREPGLTHKACIQTEARAAVAGGTTSFMEMPNTKPPATTQELLQNKYDIAAETSIGNYSFFMGASNENIEEVLKTDPKTVCGLKIFMGSSTGNMLVDNEQTLENIFSQTPMLVATHCEDEETIRKNTAHYKEKYGEGIAVAFHPIIRDVEACYKSSELAVNLAKKHNTRLHILHISTEKELELFRNDIPLEEKRITAEVCVHHLWFDSSDYYILGSKIKCNPAIKEAFNKEALFPALLDNRLDIIATDHAPHTIDEKRGYYFEVPSGLPLVQHSLNLMLEFYRKGKISLERVVEKMCHAPAICFQVKERSFLREGYYADLVLVDLNKEWRVSRDNVLYRCGWSPFQGKKFHADVTHTFVSGHLAYHNGSFDESVMGQRLEFDRA